MRIGWQVKRKKVQEKEKKDEMVEILPKRKKLRLLENRKAWTGSWRTLDYLELLNMLLFQVLHRLKSTAPNVKVELYLNTDPIDPVEDKKIIAQMPLRDKMVRTLMKWQDRVYYGSALGREDRRTARLVLQNLAEKHHPALVWIRWMLNTLEMRQVKNHDVKKDWRLLPSLKSTRWICCDLVFFHRF